jgi:hypothetical protein
MAFGTLSVDKITDSEGSTFSPSSAVFRNRIINGDMRIDQRNAGAAVTASGYAVDRWTFFENGSMVFSVQRSTTAPTGFVNSLAVTVSTAASPSAATRSQLAQAIEGFNTADLDWGTASAKTVTLSFWVRSSLTGQFGGALQNGSQNYSYPFSFTINSANTFEFKTLVVSGPTSGTWNSNNSTGIQLTFDLGMGSDLLGTAGAWASADYRGATGDVKLNETLGATLYITGVQLEVGSVATPFERRDYGRELAMCQRYFQTVRDGVLSGVGNGTTLVQGIIPPLMVPLRASPTFSSSNVQVTTASAYVGVTGVTPTVMTWSAHNNMLVLQFSGLNSVTDNRPAFIRPDSLLTISSELI